MNKSSHLIVPLVTFGVFMTEALFHYNIGAHKDLDEKRIFVIPSTKDFIKVAVIVGIFSVLNGVIIGQIKK